MATRNSSTLHPIGCLCRACAPIAQRKTRAAVAIKRASRTLILIAALIAIPFIIVHALSGVKGDHR